MTRGFAGEGGRIDGHFTGCDMIPTFYEELRGAGRDLDMEIFQPSVHGAAMVTDEAATFGARQ